MGTGQTIITIGALMLLSFSVLNLNRAINTVDISLLQSKHSMEALGLLNEYAEEVQRTFFDETSLDTSSAKLLTDLTLPANLGLEVNDAGTIDDFDDYHNQTIQDTSQSGIPYELAFTVEYVEISGSQLITSSSRQFHKRMYIRIYDTLTDPLLTREINGVTVRDTMKVSFVQSYWFYN